MTTEPAAEFTAAARVDAGLGALIGVWGYGLVAERLAALYPLDDPEPPGPEDAAPDLPALRDAVVDALAEVSLFPHSVTAVRNLEAANRALVDALL